MPQIVTFDGVGRRIIEVSAGSFNEIDIAEVYSEWKEWVRSDPANAGIERAFRQVGGDPLTDTQNLGSTFFLMNGWRIRPAESDHKLTVVGNVFTDPAGDSVFVPTLGSFTVNTETRVSNLVDSSVSRLDLAQLQEAIFIDTISGEAGTDEGVGTPTRPVNNLVDAKTIALRDNLRVFSIIGSVTLNENYSSWKFLGTLSPSLATVNFNGFTCNYCVFEKLTLTGEASNSNISAFDCLIDDVLHVQGSISNSEIIDVTASTTGARLVLHRCSAYAEESTIDLVAAVNNDLYVHGWSGHLELRNLDVPDEHAHIEMLSGLVTLASTCTDGHVIVRGVGNLEDGSSQDTVVDRTGLVSPVTVWDEMMSAHTTAGSAANMVKLIQTLLGLQAAR